jgi:hypothetical protein
MTTLPRLAALLSTLLVLSVSVAQDRAVDAGPYVPSPDSAGRAAAPVYAPASLYARHGRALRTTEPPKAQRP